MRKSTDRKLKIANIAVERKTSNKMQKSHQHTQEIHLPKLQKMLKRELATTHREISTMDLEIAIEDAAQKLERPGTAKSTDEEKGWQ